MMMRMPRSVHITTPRASYEELVKQLRIPKARQRVLRERIEEAWKRMLAVDAPQQDDSTQPKEMSESAAVSR
jgi:hypothetical protein